MLRSLTPLNGIHSPQSVYKEAARSLFDPKRQTPWALWYVWRGRVPHSEVRAAPGAPRTDLSWGTYTYTTWRAVAPLERCPLLPELWGYRSPTYLFLLLSLMNIEGIFFFPPWHTWKDEVHPSSSSRGDCKPQAKTLPSRLRESPGAKLRIGLSFPWQMVIRRLFREGGTYNNILKVVAGTVFPEGLDPMGC